MAKKEIKVEDGSKEKNKAPTIDKNSNKHDLESTEDVLNEALAKIEAEAKENYDKYLRAVAEMENFKKRAIKERADLIRYAGENLARDLLEVVDNLELACAHKVEGSSEEVTKGISLILDRFKAILDQYQIKSQSCLGQEFDPEKQEAISTQPTNEKKAGTVVEEYRKAYFFKDKLLRPAQVIVAVEEPKGQKESEGA
jgi:molecular chaperone GrpE